MQISSGGIGCSIQWEKFAEFGDLVTNAASQALKTTAFEIQRQAQMSMSGESPSAPGSPPAVVTGVLKSSIMAEKQEKLYYTITAYASYSAYLEFGHHSRGGTWVAARPFLTPAYERNRDRLLTTLKGLLNG